MPIRRPELEHDALFTAHRRNRHLGAIAEEKAPTVSAVAPTPQVASSSAATTEAHPAAESGPARPADAAGAAARSQRGGIASAAKATSHEMLTIKMVVPYPAPGTSAALDALAAEIGEDAAVRSLLRRAFDDVRRLLEAGEMPEALPAYDEAGATVATTRRISRHAHEIAARHLDPARLLSDRAFARLLARRALAHFFETERRNTARRA